MFAVFDFSAAMRGSHGGRPATRRAMMPMMFDERSSSFDDLFAKIAAL
jgi:hypothetical protein